MKRINFELTEETNGFITYYDYEDDVVFKCSLSSLENYVYINDLNITDEQEGDYFEERDEHGGFITTPTESYVYQPMQDYLRENWLEVTEEYYNSLNR